jgi:hypothetical protein
MISGTRICRVSLPIDHRCKCLTPFAILINSTALRRSWYDSQVEWGIPTRYWLFKGYKLDLGTTVDGIILSHVLTTVNHYDTAATPEVHPLQEWTSFPKITKIPWCIDRGIVRLMKNSIFFSPNYFNNVVGYFYPKQTLILTIRLRKLNQLSLQEKALGTKT